MHSLKSLGHSASRSAAVGWAVFAIVGQEGPDDAGKLVRQRDRDYVWMASCVEALEPSSRFPGRISLQAPQNRMRAKDEKRTQIPVPSFADTKETRLAAR